MKHLLSFLLLIVIYEENDLTRQIIVYDYTKEQETQKSIVVHEPEADEITPEEENVIIRPLPRQFNFPYPLW